MDARTRQILEQEKDPKVLRALIADLIEYNKRLENLVDKAHAEKARQSQTAFTLEERVKLLRRMIFGKKSEVRAGDRARDVSQQEAQLFSQAAFPSPDLRADQKGKSKGRELEEVVIEHHPELADLKEEETLRGIQDGKWIKTGLYDECTKIQIIERKYVREIHRKFKVKLDPASNPDPDKEVIVTASGPEELLAGMNYSTEFIAAVASDKYISHMPLERQTREMESLGLKGIRTSTLSRLCALAAASLEPLQEKILKEDLLPSDLALHLDETPWKIQNRDQKDGYMWVISNRYGSYYFFKPTRSGKVLQEKLAGYTGPVLTDGFSGYNILTELKIPQANCWAHARREFLPLEDHDPTVKPILDLIDELFRIEREAKSFDELGRLRLEKSKPVLNVLRELLLSELPKSRTDSQKRKAIMYSLARWDGLTMFASEIKLPLSNNEAERTIRHAVMGRKNYYGSGNYTGAETAATLFTIIESCKKNDIDPRTFLLMSLNRVASDQELETPLAYARRTRSLN
jgi:transposase